MNVTEVRVELAEAGNQPEVPRVLAYFVVTLDDEFVIRNFKLVRTRSGLVLCMPSRRVEDHCPACGKRGPVEGRYCPHCGERRAEGRAAVKEGRPQHHTDVVHPVTHACRARLEELLIGAYRAKEAGARVVVPPAAPTATEAAYCPGAPAPANP